MSYEWRPCADHNSVFVDVDGCLLIWPGKKRGRIPRKGEPGYGESPTPNLQVIEMIKKHKAKGRYIVVWSRGGARHARMAVEHCGLGDVVDLCLAKPRTVIDDSFGWWERNERVKV